jgi:glycosyltransferase involved in cell wall biosynthesis
MAADLAVSFIKACYSKQSSSPTKVAEYLACGLPIVANGGVGDLDALIENNGVGVLVDGFDKEAYRKVFAIDPDELREKCMAVAAREFDLESVAGERYRRIYGSLLRMRRG